MHYSVSNPTYQHCIGLNRIYVQYIIKVQSKAKQVKGYTNIKEVSTFMNRKYWKTTKKTVRKGAHHNQNTNKYKVYYNIFCWSFFLNFVSNTKFYLRADCAFWNVFHKQAKTIRWNYFAFTLSVLRIKNT